MQSDSVQRNSSPDALNNLSARNHIGSRAQSARGVLTIRGAIFLAAGGLGLLLAYQWNDLISTVLAPTVLCLLALCVTRTVMLSRKVARVLGFSLSFASADGKLFGQQPTPATITAQGLSGWLAFWELRVAFNWSIEGHVRPDLEILSPLRYTHFTSDSSSVSSTITRDGLFPHRGNYRCTAATISVQDPFGFTERRLTIPLDDTNIFTVEPVQSLYPWEVVSSVERAGDTVQLSQERLGARLDLKSYHPADGMRSIAWKIFARRGELLSRTPEAAATPDGTVILYVVAPALADDVAGAAVAYARRCAEIGAQTLAGTLGDPRRTVSTNADQLLEATVRAAPTANQSASQLSLEIVALIESIQSSDRHIHARLLALVLPERVSAVLASQLQATAQLLAQRHIAVSALVVPQSHATLTKITSNRSAFALFEPLAESSSTTEANSSDSAAEQSAIEICAQLGFTAAYGEQPSLARSVAHG